MSEKIPAPATGTVPNIRFAISIAVIVLMLLAAYFYVSISGREPGGMMVGRDFINLYTAGELLAENKQHMLFSQQAYMEVLWAKYGSDYTIHGWSYPPTLFWLAEVFTIFPCFCGMHLAFH
ncbi:hypothetical protein [Parasulfitobacter algicola]|uniref:Uncharacterized protein n=1 Tax=Parasulfitobacter algicola TaxID=2614809 RepID=A0ABX2ISQ0_9RHOB|nr:hypothetical protein [Sulfitobacter algicola]NSX55938.1 hypothetical protein [Sulfitobacter algicola]